MQQKQPTDYGRIVHTGPGTSGGRYLRSFWQPVCVAADLPAGRAKPLTVMSENFTLYRGDSGAAQVLAPYCAHRGTLLSTGWVEGDALRCFYHGWKYGANGRCVEAPAEREGFANTVGIRSYPTREYLGLIFAYLGDGEPPQFPRYRDLEDEGVLEAKRYRRDCNFFNNMENQCDPVHVAFAHRISAFTAGGLVGVPLISAEETAWGLALRAERPAGGVRVTQIGMPNILHIKSSPAEPGAGWSDLFAWRVPIDDGVHNSFNIHLHRLTGEAAARFRARQGKRSGDPRPVQELAAAIRRGEMTIEDVKDHPDIVGIQDDIAQLGQGVIADRDNEYLGRSDAGIVLLRKLWLRELDALDAGRPTKAWQWNRDLAATVGVSGADA
ncbi:MAG TPA: Rieske 2Fe-2S domain-containing protein [Stellaceae bacterium]|jgi:5,5'-dehydrodivanillate O-demethylase|nr:Rieske 2Fe-2S domain-containing protein [Stellaceae bacterium]